MRIHEPKETISIIDENGQWVDVKIGQSVGVKAFGHWYSGTVLKFGRTLTNVGYTLETLDPTTWSRVGVYRTKNVSVAKGTLRIHWVGLQDWKDAEKGNEVYDQNLRAQLESKSEDWCALINASRANLRLDDHWDRVAKVTESTGVPWYVLHDLLRREFRTVR